MNRRKYLKSVLGLIGAGLAGYSLSEWLHLRPSIQGKELWKERALVGELVELIIPTTDTPGARSAMVHDYVINVILYCNNNRQQHIFYSGLKDVEHYAQDKFTKTFAGCSLEEKTSVLEHFAVKSEFSYAIIRKINKKLFGQPFYSKLRELTVEGYCQSKLGATQALSYDFIPGEYLSVPVTRNQRSWATK